MWRSLRLWWLSGGLRASDAGARARAADRLGRLRHPGAVGLLAAALADPERSVRLAAARALGNCRDVRAVPPLVEALRRADREKDWETWQAAAGSLGELRAADGVEALLKLFDEARTRPDAVVETALRVVGQIGEGRGALLAVRWLSPYPADGVRTAAEQTVRQLGAGAVGPLCQGLLKEHWPPFAAGLALLGWRPGTSEERIWWGLARREHELVTAEGAAAVEPVGWWFERLPEQRLEVLPLLGRLPASAVGPVLVRLLEKTTGGYGFDERRRQEAVELIGLLGRLRVAEAVPVLLRLAWDHRGLREVAAAVTGALIQLGPASSGPVQAALRAGKLDEEVGLEVLRRVGAPGASPDLVALLGHWEPRVGRLASELLGRLSWQPGTPHEAALWHIARSEWAKAARLGEVGLKALLQALGRPRERQEWAGLCQVLARTGDARVVGPLVDCVVSSCADCAQAAVASMAELGGAAVPPLLAHLDRDLAPEATQAVVEALVQVGAPAVSALVARLADPDRREPAAQALQAMGWRPKGAAQSVGYAIALGRLEEAGALGEAAVEPLLGLWQPGEVPQERLEAVVQALGRTGSARAARHLLGVLGGWPWHSAISKAAALALGQLRAPEALGPLLECLEHLDAEVCATAARALGLLGDGRAVEPLLRLLCQEGPAARREAVAAALGGLGDLKAAEPLLRLVGETVTDRIYPYGSSGEERSRGLSRESPLQREADALRSAALASIRALGGGVVPIALPYLRDDSESLRRAAVLALGQLGLPLVLPVLLEALRHPKGDVRATAADVLTQRGWQPADPGQQAWLLAGASRGKYEDVLGMGAAAACPLMYVVATREGVWSQNAAEALRSLEGQLRAPAALPYLVEGLRDSHWEVRAQAASYLGRLSSPEVVPLLESLLDDPEEAVQDAALRALAALGWRPRLARHQSRLTDLRARDAERSAQEAERRARQAAEILSQPVCPCCRTPGRVVFCQHSVHCIYAGKKLCVSCLRNGRCPNCM